MTVDQMQDVLSRINFTLLGSRATFHVDPEKLYLQIRWWGKDAQTCETGLIKGRKWLLSEFMTTSELVQTALLACLTAVEHEVRENFTYEGEAIFSPHYDVDVLKVLRSDPEFALALREPISK